MPPFASRDSSSPQDSNTQPAKRRRITRACDRCHRSGVKCSASADPTTCGPCFAFGSECTYNRPVKRRGPVPRVLPTSGEDGNGAATTVDPDAWTYEAVAAPDVIEHLVDAYHRIVYPMLPYFHWPTFIVQVRAQRYTKDRAFFATVMSVCAIAEARLRDGAGSMGDSWALPSNAPVSEKFYTAATRAFPSDLSQAIAFDYKRAKVILAMLCIQYGHVSQLATNLGDYMTLCASDAFHNEARWPAGLPETEIQERRRLFWGAYSIDVYSATTWGFLVRHRELQSTVLYPTAVDDEYITENGIVTGPEPRICWIQGWNFTNDLYRILEHALDQVRQRRVPNDTSRVTALFLDRARPSPDEVLDVVEKLYDELPPQFKTAKAVTGNLDEDRFGFQAADIIVTMQTVKMVVMALQDSTVEKRCAVAGKLLDALSTVPTAYIQAISSPILHHLAGVGHLLGSVIQSPLSHWSYLQVRHVLLAMADLLSSLESTLSFVPGIADKLRDHVYRIDQYMTTAALDRSRREQVFHTALPASAWSSTSPVVPGSMDSNMRTSTKESRAHRPQVSVSPETQPWSAASSNVTPSAPNDVPALPPGDFPSGGVGADLLKINPPPMPADGNEFQFQLPDDLILEWPIDLSEAFDFLNTAPV